MYYLRRFDPEVLSYIPDNVMVVDWMPQLDLLGQQSHVLIDNASKNYRCGP